MGTGLDGDMVDGILYFESKSSEARIRSWYVTRLQKLGYGVTGEGQSAAGGKIISDNLGLTKAPMP